jgi:hypothetical protein
MAITAGMELITSGFRDAGIARRIRERIGWLTVGFIGMVDMCWLRDTGGRLVCGSHPGWNDEDPARVGVLFCDGLRKTATADSLQE